VLWNKNGTGYLAGRKPWRPHFLNDAIKEAHEPEEATRGTPAIWTRAVQSLMNSSSLFRSKGVPSAKLIST
jgi:hypothetical protein